MNSLYRSISIYSRLHFLLRLYSPSTKIIMSHRRSYSSGDGLFPTPKKRTSSSSESFCLEGNDYEVQFPPLNGSKNKSVKGSRLSMFDHGSTNLSTTSKSSQSLNSTSGKDTGIQEEANGPTVEVGFGTGSKHKGNGSRRSMVDHDSTNLSTPNKSAQFENRTSGKDVLSLQRNLECKNRDQVLPRRRGLTFDTYAPVDKRNNTKFHFKKKEANGIGSKHEGNGSLRSIADLDFTDPSTWSQRSHSQDWRIRNDLSMKRNHRYPGWKNRDQSSKWIQESPFDICSVHKINDRCVTDQFIEEEANGEETWEAVELSNISRVLRPGMVLLKHHLTHDLQVDIVKTCRELGVKPQGFYQPGYGDGSKLRLQMMCLGRNWDPQTKYGKNTELNSEPPSIPETFCVLVEQAIREAHALIDSESGKEDAESELPMMSPDICIVNFYTETGRLGLHQDRDESRESMKKGLPIVSFSIGDSAEFLYGEERDVEKAERVKLESGDVLIFGGESRMIFHGVKSIKPNSAPISLLHDSKLRTGRLNLTFRHF